MLDVAILLAWFVGAVASAIGVILMWVIVAQDREARAIAILYGAIFFAMAVLSVVQAGKMLERMGR